MKEIPYLATAVGNVVENYRWARKFTKSALACACEIERRYLFEIEKGCRNPTITVIYRICQALQVSPSEFFKAVEEERLRLISLSECKDPSAPPRQSP